MTRNFMGEITEKGSTFETDGGHFRILDLLADVLMSMLMHRLIGLDVEGPRMTTGGEGDLGLPGKLVPSRTIGHVPGTFDQSDLRKAIGNLLDEEMSGIVGRGVPTHDNLLANRRIG